MDRYKTQLNKNSSRPWLISFCLPASVDNEQEQLNHELNCLDELVMRKLAIMLHGLVRVATVNCNKKSARENLCPVLEPNAATPILFYTNTLPNITRKNEPADDESYKSVPIVTADYKLIVESILAYLPALRELDQAEFEAILASLRDREASERPWLIQFVQNYQADQDLELKKLPSLLKPSKC